MTGSDATYTWRGALGADGKPDGPGALVNEATGAVHEGRMAHGLRQGQWVAARVVVAAGWPGSSSAGGAWAGSPSAGRAFSGYAYACTDDVQGEAKVRLV